MSLIKDQCSLFSQCNWVGQFFLLFHVFWLFVQLNLRLILEAQVFLQLWIISARLFSKKRRMHERTAHRKVQAPRLVQDVVAHPSHAGMAKTPWQNQPAVAATQENQGIVNIVSSQTILQSLGCNYSTTICQLCNYRCEYANRQWFHGRCEGRNNEGKTLRLQHGRKRGNLRQPGYEQERERS